MKMLDVSRAKVGNISCDTTMTRSGGVKMLRVISISEGRGASYAHCRRVRDALETGPLKQILPASSRQDAALLVQAVLVGVPQRNGLRQLRAIHTARFRNAVDGSVGALKHPLDLIVRRGYPVVELRQKRLQLISLKLAAFVHVKLVENLVYFRLAVQVPLPHRNGGLQLRLADFLVLALVSVRADRVRAHHDKRHLCTHGSMHACQIGTRGLPVRLRRDRRTDPRPVCAVLDALRPPGRSRIDAGGCTGRRW